MIDGWVKLHRKMTDWEWYTDGNTVRVFIHLILMASHEDHKWMGIDIKKGQVISGRIKIAEELKISQRSVRTAITKLKSTNELTSKSTNKYTVFTIVKYDEYQQNDQQNAKQTTSKRPANDHIQEWKELKNIYSTKEFLKNIPISDLEQISKDLGVDHKTITLKAEQLYDWCESKGRTYKNYKAFLKNCLRQDSVKTKQVNLLSGGIRYEELNPNL